MKIPVWYCEKNIELELPDSCRVDLYDLPAKRLTPLDANHWINTGKVPEELASFIGKSQELLVIVNDHYRPTPTARVLKAIIGALHLESTTFLVATALHGVPDEKALVAVFGELYPQIKDRMKIHSAYDESELVTFGSGDRQVRLNRCFERCDSVLIIGSVEPHYFAGFTGGRKIVLPGCASFADVARNHGLALSPRSQPLAQRGNPVWEDIWTRTACLDYKRRFAIQLVCDHRQTIFHLSSGDWDQAYSEACRFVKAHYAHLLDDPYDTVISVVYPPLDKNLYQVQKAYENVATVVRDGGSILLVSGCREGIGDRRFVQLAELASSGNDLYDPISLLMGIHKIKRTEALAKRVDLILLSTLAKENLRYLPIKPAADISTAVNELMMKYGNKSKIAVVLDSGTQVLYRHQRDVAGQPSPFREETHA